ncbi:hypothetical protein ACN38_g1179 [Penicillium nordicum]|uniref:Uncharacterized protein n=1 Tax=Penicillium nordicum TaxID=229535 RepID=A0A0M9WK46_9EURO|nr:hypothetical protein ACN38_g1179 [Penicillium nordicum]
MGLEFSLRDGCRLNVALPLWQKCGYLPQIAGNGRINALNAPSTIMGFCHRPSIFRILWISTPAEGMKIIVTTEKPTAGVSLNLDLTLDA